MEQGTLWSQSFFITDEELEPRKGKESAPKVTSLINSRIRTCTQDSQLRYTSSALRLQQEVGWLYAVDFENKLSVGVRAGSALSLAYPRLEQSQELGSFCGWASWLTPRKPQPLATAQTLSLISNSRLTDLELECTGAGDQAGSPGSQEKDGCGGGRGPMFRKRFFIPEWTYNLGSGIRNKGSHCSPWSCWNLYNILLVWYPNFHSMCIADCVSVCHRPHPAG
jgi:hypothetical protein